MGGRFDRLRADYRGHALEGGPPADPITLFTKWFDAAVARGIDLANAMALATVGADGRPSLRMVLLKDIDPLGRLWFFTNYDSQKGRELTDNPSAALLFYWEPMHRQIRVEGRVERLGAAESDAYFATRPREASLSAMASRQSEMLAGGRAQLVSERESLEWTWLGRELERPEGWGGFALTPDRYEFWQGRPDRLHDRLNYRRVGDHWEQAWLYP